MNWAGLSVTRSWPPMTFVMATAGSVAAHCQRTRRSRRCRRAREMLLSPSPFSHLRCAACRLVLLKTERFLVVGVYTEPATAAEAIPYIHQKADFITTG